MNLQRLAELINAKWPHAERKPHANAATLSFFKSDPSYCLYCLGFNVYAPDHANAEFIIWCLDRLDELGFTCALYRDSVYLERDGIGEGVDGKTRAEACALALMQALEGE